MKKLMNRAWEIYRTLTGTHKEKLSKALKIAWKEVKNMAKATFEKFAKVAKKENASDNDDAGFLFFKKWEKNGKRRIYVNDYKKRTVGYIENNAFTLIDMQGNFKSEIEFALKKFNETYAF